MTPEELREAAAERARLEARAQAERVAEKAAIGTRSPQETAEYRDVLHDQLLWERARREARAILDTEESADVDFDALFLDRGQLDGLQSPNPLIPGVLPRHAYGVLRGRDQSFKSFVALDWSLSLATGRFWNMLPVSPARVLYIAGEGAWGLRSRLAAWESRSQLAVDPDMFTVRQVALNLHRPGPAFAHLLEHIEAGAYGLVVVDTLRRVSGAADGNGSEMGAVVDNLDAIKHATHDGSVLVVAHTDKGDNDSRGYSGIEDDADFVWHARREGLQLELELTKMKDGPDGITVHMRAFPVPEHGSLVLTPAVKVERDEATESEGKLLTTLLSVFPEGAYSGALRDASGLPKTTYHRALAALVRRGAVQNSGSHQRPFYEATGLTAPAESHMPQSPADLQESHQVPPESQGVPLVPRPLGSGTRGTETPEADSSSREQAELLARLTEKTEDPA